MASPMATRKEAGLEGTARQVTRARVLAPEILAVAEVGAQLQARMSVLVGSPAGTKTIFSPLSFPRPPFILSRHPAPGDQ